MRRKRRGEGVYIGMERGRSCPPHTLVTPTSHKCQLNVSFLLNFKQLKYVRLKIVASGCGQCAGMWVWLLVVVTGWDIE